jgi:hypothetical protein
MLYNEIRKKAEKKVQAKLAFYICSIVFAFTSVILLMLSYYLPSVAHWLRLPIPVFIMVLGVLYLTAFGMPFTGTHGEDWQEEEIQKEMLKLYRQRKGELPPFEDLPESEVLKLKELEELEQKWNRDEDFV